MSARPNTNWQLIKNSRELAVRGGKARNERLPATPIDYPRSFLEVDQRSLSDIAFRSGKTKTYFQRAGKSLDRRTSSDHFQYRMRVHVNGNFFCRKFLAPVSWL
jgi:hypothetical protein